MRISLRRGAGSEGPALRPPQHPTRRRVLTWLGVLVPPAALVLSLAATDGRLDGATDRAGARRAPATAAGDTMAVHRAAPAASAPAPAVADEPRDDTTRLARATATAPDSGLRILVSLSERRLWVVRGRDTLRSAPVGVGMDSTLVHEGRVWNFETPRGVRRVRSKEANPVWVPPDWHYVETAHDLGLKVAHLERDVPVTLSDSSRIEVRGDRVGIVRPGVPWTPFTLEEEIIWDGTLFIPPIGTKNRRISGELGSYRLDLGDGYLLHGTPYTESIGRPSSHGCIRLYDRDVAWLYAVVPVGTPVVLF